MKQALIYALWITPAVLQLAMLFIMTRHGVRSQFPAFFAYTALQVFNAALLFFLYRWSEMSYFYGYWILNALSVGLAFQVLYELFAIAFKPYPALRTLGLALFRWATLILLLAAAVSAMATHPGDEPRIITAIFTMERSVRLMQCGLVFLLFLFSAALGLTRKHRVVGFALGFGLFACVELVVASLWSHFGHSAGEVLSLMKSGAYNISVLIWMVYLISVEPERLRGLSTETSKTWNYGLMALLPYPNDSYLPKLERMVDSVLIKRHHDVSKATLAAQTGPS